MPQPLHFNESTPSKGAELRAAERIPYSPRLLVSIRNASEAMIALSAGVDWIDLKEPGTGALGRAEQPVAEAVAMALTKHDQRSAALGELVELPVGVASQFAKLFPYVKVGLASTTNSPSPALWRKQLLQLATELRTNGSQLIPVIYADYLNCNAPDPEEIVEIARQTHSPYLLVDTYFKDGRRLTDWLDFASLAAIKNSASKFGCQVVFAGSLRPEDVQLLGPIEPYAFAVRGAVCSGSRAESICPEKIAQWCDLVHLAGK